MRFSSFESMNPDLSASKTSNAFLIVWSLFSSCILCAISAANSAKSTVPFPSASAASIIFLSSSSLGVWPSDAISARSSWASMLPPPSVSYCLNASWNSSSCICVRRSTGVPVMSGASSAPTEEEPQPIPQRITGPSFAGRSGPSS